MVEFRPPVAPLFVPADRPDRYIKAATSGADAVIIDLEDAVDARSKDAARQALTGRLGNMPIPVIIRINGVDTPWHAEDVAAIRGLDIAAVMLPKASSLAAVETLAATIGRDMPVIALIETVAGMANLDALVRAEPIRMLAFGSIDYSLDLGCSEDRLALLHARAELVFRSRLGGLCAPLDGVHRAINDPPALLDDCRHGVSLGFGGKLAIHPGQVALIRQTFAPSADELSWARQIIAASQGGAAQWNGEMVDKPVLERARRIVDRAPPQA